MKYATILGQEKTKPKVKRQVLNNISNHSMFQRCRMKFIKWVDSIAGEKGSERRKKKKLVANLYFTTTITGKIRAVGLMTQNALALSDKVKITLFASLTGSFPHEKSRCSNPALVTFVLFSSNYRLPQNGADEHEDGSQNSRLQSRGKPRRPPVGCAHRKTVSTARAVKAPAFQRTFLFFTCQHFFFSVSTFPFLSL